MNASHKQKVEELFEAALDCVQSEQTAFLAAECENHPAILAEVKLLLAAREEARADSFLNAPAFEMQARYFAAKDEKENLPQQNIGHYKIVERIGAGGMGTIYKAVRDDKEYKTIVAVKLIKRGMDTDYILSRFKNERQILANLNHPNIARLFEGGTTVDGLPYFVMEYIEGRPLNEYCNERKLSVKARLELFRTICSAVQYAHQNLVIHRDIKPSNILVTEDGTPKLLDFGIAKILQHDSDAEAAPTATELRILTPEYASPEQFKGEAVNVSSDVYSLGVVLYELLTGLRPHCFKSRRPDEIARTICEQEPEKPSGALLREREKRRRRGEEKEPVAKENFFSSSPLLLFSSSQLKGDIDNIVLTAIRKEPSRRYATVEKFSDDIRRHLEGLPVFARKNTFFYNSAKFVQRHKLGVIAAVLIALSLIGGIVATSRQTIRAERERALSERRLSDVRAMANWFMFEINEEIERNPTRARQLLVNRAVEYLDKSAAEAEGDASLQSELATAYLKIGDLQSALYTANIGDSSGALESYGKALKINEALYQAEPKNLSVGLNLSASCLKMGDISAKTGNIAAAADFHRRAVNLNEQFVAAEPANVQTRTQLAQSLLKLGQAVYRTGDLPEVLSNYRRSLAIYEQLAAENPADLKAQRYPASLLNYIGFVLNDMGKNDEAFECYRRALEIGERILAAEPDNSAARRDVREFQHWFAIQLKVSGDTDASLAHHQKSQIITRELLSADETNVQERNTLADSQMETGKTLAQAGRAKEAAASYQEAIGNYEQVQKTDARNAHVRCQIAYTKLFFAETLANTGEKARALNLLGQTLKAFKELTAEDPNNKEWQHFLAINYQKTGKILLKQNKNQEAAENLQKSLTILENLAAESPSNISRKNDLVMTRNILRILSASNG